jgi:hypothetical protein
MGRRSGLSGPGRTVVGKEANVHKNGLVLGGGAGESVLVEQLPGHGCLGMASNVWAVALASTVAERREVGGGRSAVMAFLLLTLSLALFQLCPHHLG